MSSNKQRIEINNEHIWQYNDLDSNAISILHIDRKLIENVNEFKQRLQEISSKYDGEYMTIKVHGMESGSQQKGVVWIRVHSKSADSRREAIRLINEFTGDACKEVIIPKLSQEHAKKLDEVNESLQQHSLDKDDLYDNDDCFIPVRSTSTINDYRKQQPTMISSQSSFTITNTINKNGSTYNDNNAINSSNKSTVKSTSSSKGRRPLMRSSTENFISSLKQANSSTPFGSILAPLGGASNKLDEEEQTEDLTKEEEEANVNGNESSKKTDLDRVQEAEQEKNKEKTSERGERGNKEKKTYSLDFLLSRANCESSKQMPSNWRQLNELYPNICFAGKVISYFNPDKYHEHWVRVQNQNPDWHHPIAWVQRRLGPALAKQIRQHFNNDINSNTYQQNKIEENDEKQQSHQQQQFNARWNYPLCNQTQAHYHHRNNATNIANNSNQHNVHSQHYYPQHRESATALMQPHQYRQNSMTHRNGGGSGTNFSKHQQQTTMSYQYKQPTYKPLDRISNSIAQQKRNMNSQQHEKLFGNQPSAAATNKHTDLHRFYD